MNNKISIILPARNEAESLKTLLPRMLKINHFHELIVVNDASTDNTTDICQQYNVKVINHNYQKGNGAAIKSGTRAATGNILIFMDADGQHNPERIPEFMQKIEQGFDMVVGARSSMSQASIARSIANQFYNWLASRIVEQKIDDLTSGFRAVKAKPFQEFLYLLPNGFSYPTTITMTFFRYGYSVGYIPVEAKKRLGKSHIKWFKDGIRFVIIITKICTLYSPAKIFIPTSICTFITGLLYYLYTYVTDGRFTNMGVLLFSTSILIFLMGMISEQITTLIYRKQHED